MEVKQIENEHVLKKELYQYIKSDESYFDFIQDGSLDGIWYWNLEEPEQIWMSPRFWTTMGYEPSEMKHLTSQWQEVIFEDDLKIAIENFYKHIENPKYAYDQILRYKHKNGSTVWVRCRGIAIRDKDNTPIRMLGAHNDLTSVITLQKEIEERDKVKLLNEKLSQSGDIKIELAQDTYYSFKLKVIKYLDNTIKLTDREIFILELLIKNKNGLTRYEDLLYELNQDGDISNNSLSLSISRLRKKLFMIDIQTVYSRGLILSI